MSWPPNSGRESMILTDRSLIPAKKAAYSPVGPPPMTVISLMSRCISLFISIRDTIAP